MKLSQLQPSNAHQLDEARMPQSLLKLSISRDIFLSGAYPKKLVLNL